MPEIRGLEVASGRLGQVRVGELLGADAEVGVGQLAVGAGERGGVQDQLAALGELRQRLFRLGGGQGRGGRAVLDDRRQGGMGTEFCLSGTSTANGARTLVSKLTEPET